MEEEQENNKNKDNSGENDNKMKVHDDVIKWKHFPRYWPFVRGIHWSPVNELYWYRMLYSRDLTSRFMSYHMVLSALIVVRECTCIHTHAHIYMYMYMYVYLWMHVSMETWLYVCSSCVRYMYPFNVCWNYDVFSLWLLVQRVPNKEANLKNGLNSLSHARRSSR